jgi:serine/threonine-protein kinase RsbT
MSIAACGSSAGFGTEHSPRQQMIVRRREVIQLRGDGDVVRARQAVRAICTESGFTLVDQTKMVTAASELARNTIVHGRGGTLTMESLEDGTRRGVKLLFEDQGPGIQDTARALQDGYTTGNGMGLGLPGSRRLVNEFELVSQLGVGTRVTAVRWR